MASAAGISLTEICVYPLKGARGFRPDAWPLESRGLRTDRQWMLVDADGRCVTQLINPRVTLIQTAWDAGGIVLTAPGLDATRMPLLPARATKPTRVWMEGGQETFAAAVDGDVDAWCSVALGSECRLVRRPEGTTDRWVDGRVGEGAPLDFQKAFPLHLTSQASLDDLNHRLPSPVTMDRFRPNLVISGTQPHEDDGWERIQIGETILRIGRACDHRCGVPNIDQETGVSGVEPLKTLATYRRSSKGIYFGQNVTIERAGEMRLGDAVSILERG